MDPDENFKDQLDSESHKSRSFEHDTRRKEYDKHTKRTKHNWIGHVLRHDGLLNRIIEGRIRGKRGRGR